MVENIRTFSRTLVREWNLLKGTFSDTGFNYSQCHALFELDRYGPLPTLPLADRLLLDKSTTSRLLHSLLAKGLVRVETDPSDTRQKWYSLTEAGRTVVQRNNCLANQQVEDALDGLREEEKEQILQGLKLYSKALTNNRLQQAFRIRPIAAADSAVISRLIRDTMTEFGCVGAGYSINDPEIEDMYTAYLAPRSIFYVVEKNERLMGCGGIGPLPGGDGRICELKKMYFLPEARGFGLGKKLLLTCLDDARRLGYTECYLETVDRMWQANLLYRKTGFKRLEQRCGDTGHCSCEAYYTLSL